MDIILQGLKHVTAIQDGILITGKDDEQHTQNLNTGLSHLDRYGLWLQLNKCKFMQQSVTYNPKRGEGWSYQERTTPWKPSPRS